MSTIKPAKQKLNISISSRLKRRVQTLASDKGITMNDLITHAIEDYLNKSDGTYQNADFVADRLSQVLNSQLAFLQQRNRLTMILDN